MKWIDTHTHLYVDAFAEDSEEVISRALESEVEYMFLPNIDRTTIDPMLALCSRYSSHLFPMMGLHPCSVRGDYNELLDEMYMMLQSELSFWGIGETGLDFYWDTTYAMEQEASFARQIQWAIEFELPIIIHSRLALDRTIELIEIYRDRRLKGIFHCFDGTIEQAIRIRELGFCLGIGGVLTYKKSELPNVIKEIGLDGVVLETDSPYLSPVPKRGRRNESGYLPYIGHKLAELLDIELAEVADQTTQQAIEIFNLH